MKKKALLPESTYAAQVFKLLKPLNNGENPDITFVTVKPVSVIVNEELNPDADKLSIDDQIAFMIPATGLSEEQVEELATTDFNTLWAAVHNNYNNNGYKLAGKKFPKKSRKVTLFFCDNKEVAFELPTLKVSRLAKKISSDFARTVFILTNITDLEDDEIKEMPLPDFRTLEKKASDFLTKPTAYFL